MGRLAVVNAPSSFTYIWNVVKRWLSPETVSKVEILGKFCCFPNQTFHMGFDVTYTSGSSPLFLIRQRLYRLLAPINRRRELTGGSGRQVHM